jgi:putative aminopeptidase FrvX
MAMNTVKATAENTAKFSVENPKPDSAIKTEVSIASYIPVGEQSNNLELFKTIREVMKELHIRLREENGADPSAILANRGIPSYSIGIARGWEGLNSDTIDIASIEKGRQLIEALIARIGRTGGQHE